MAEVEQFYVDRHSYERIQDLVQSVDHALLDARPAWRRLVIRWQDRARRQFALAQARQVRRGSRYQRRKAASGHGQPLVVTGRFKAALEGPETQELRPLDATIGVDFARRAINGQFGRDSYMLAINNRFKVWKPLSLGERIDWSHEIVTELEHQVAEARARA